MFTDLSLSREVNGSFPNSFDSNLDVNFNIGSAANWPSFESIPIRRPPELQQALTKFSQHYSTVFPSRRLEFFPTVGTCIVAFTTPKYGESLGSKYELMVSELQACVLQCFDRVRAVSYSEIETVTGIPFTHLSTTLQTLCSHRNLILLKKPTSSTISKTDSFYPNIKFKSKLFRIKILAELDKDTDSNVESEEVESRIIIERESSVDACIVRILKMRRRCSYQDLITQVLESTIRRGSVIDNQFVKKRIESLIDREYMERDELDSNIFNYLA
ncbi:hypothetical protein GEMRC1_005186 [Eukaryota sp. GEM-RC1]